MSDVLADARKCIASGEYACADDPPGNWIEVMESLVEEVERTRNLMQSLLNKVNAVTSAWRHIGKVSPENMDALSNRQIEVEQGLKGENHEMGQTT